MSKYYLVPITAKKLKIKGKTFFEMLENIDRDLYNRELRRIEITYESPMCKYYQESGLIDEYNNNTRLLYINRKIPEKLVIKLDKSKLYEVLSKTEIECDDLSYLEVFEANVDDIKECVNNSLYEKNVLRFIKLGLKDRNVFIKRKNSVKQDK